MTKASTPLHRIAGNLALDLANTISWRGTEREIDHLGDADAIIAWALGGGLVENGYKNLGLEDTRLVADVQRLRGAVNDAGAAIAGRAAPPAKALTIIHRYAAQSFAAASLTGVPTQIVFAPADAIIGPVAWATLKFLRGNELHRLKRCPPDDCRWLFIDRTKNGSRRWCEMATCGNRAKAISRQ